MNRQSTASAGFVMTAEFQYSSGWLWLTIASEPQLRTRIHLPSTNNTAVSCRAISAC